MTIILNLKIRYIISGVIVNIFGFIFYIILLKIFNLSPFLSTSIMYPIIIVIYYLSQSFFVFKKKLTLKFFIKYLINFFVFYLINIALLFIFIEMVNLKAIPSQFFIILLMSLVNYLSQKKFVFN